MVDGGSKEAGKQFRRGDDPFLIFSSIKAVRRQCCTTFVAGICSLVKKVHSGSLG
jgi:hypothetical protein